MADVVACADNAISDFVKIQIGSPPWPNWRGLIPGDTQNGWGASKPSWRAQALSIISDFENCAGVQIVHNTSHIDKLRSKTLTTFRDYLVEQAGVAAAAEAVKAAKAALEGAKANLATTSKL
jgi:hypothetical protein